MIVKKPYAFLIKHFKLIHLLLSLLIIVLLLKSRNIYIFFNDYAKNGYYTYINDLANNYVSGYMFLSIVFIIVLTTFIYLLMRWKKKNRKLYISLFAFYIILMAAYLFIYNVFNNLVNNPLDIRAIRAYRDIALLIYVPQYIFALICIVRATGFNIKQFDFKKDLEELDIAEEDQEEIEVTLGSNTYKIKRWFRKTYREFINYTKEYKYFFWLTIGIIFIVIFAFIFFGRDRSVKTYNESEYYIVNGIRFKVQESYITDIDYNGNIILKGKNYILVKLSMENTNKAKASLDTDILRLKINEEEYKPIYSASDYFKDLGEAYYKNSLYNGEVYEYLLIYEIPKEIDYSDVKFRMASSVTNTLFTYKEVKLNPKEFFMNDKVIAYNLKDIVGLENTTLKASDLIIENYEIGDSFIEEYTYCASSCYQGKKVIKPSLVGKGENTILKISMSSSIDKNIYINQFINNNSNFIKYFGRIEYIRYGKRLTSNLNVISLDNINTSNVYLEVDNSIKEASNIYLVLTIRNKVIQIQINL